MLLDLDYSTFEIPDTDATIEVKPLDVKSYQKILQIMATLSSTEDAVTTGLEQLSSPQISELAQQILPSFTRNLKGIQIKKDGKIDDAKIDDLLEHGAFLQVCFHILLHLFTISGLSKEAENKVKK